MNLQLIVRKQKIFLVALDNYLFNKDMKNLQETMRLIKFIRNERRVILARDLNTGPSIPSRHVKATAPGIRAYRFFFKVTVLLGFIAEKVLIHLD